MSVVVVVDVGGVTTSDAKARMRRDNAFGCVGVWVLVGVVGDGWRSEWKEE